MIKRYILAALLVLFAVPAMATMNIQQRSDGTADFTGSLGTEGTANCVGGRILQVGPVVLSTPANYYTTTDITNAVIKDVYGVRGSTTAGGKITVYLNQSSSAVQFVNPTGTTKATDATLQFNSGSVGTVQSISTLQQINAQMLMANVIGAKQMINLVSDGGSTATATATIFIKACPR